MKFNMRFLTYLIFLLPFFVSAQLVDIDSIENKGHIVLLLHPTESNIKNFCWLVDTGFIDIDSLTIMGVCYKYDNYDFSKSIDYVKNNDIGFVKFVEVNDSLGQDEIFKKNACTDDFEKLFDVSDGVIFTGGDDLPPYVYGEQTSLLTSNSNTLRHFFELSFLYHLAGAWENERELPLMNKKKDYVVWAICLGMQTMNVALGGTLVQDIPSQLYSCNTVEDVLKLNNDENHKNYYNRLHPEQGYDGGTFHRIKFTGESFAKKIADKTSKSEPYVYSYHHQCVGKIGKGLQVVATSMDGKVPEMIASTKYKNFTGFQFHFEYKYLYSGDSTHKLYWDGKQNITTFSFVRNVGTLNFYKGLWKYFSTLINGKKD